MVVSEVRLSGLTAAEALRVVELTRFDGQSRELLEALRGMAVKVELVLSDDGF